MSGLPPVFMEFIGMTTGFKAATREVISGLDAVERHGSGLGKKVTKGGLIAMAAVSTAVVGGIIATTKAAGDYQFQMNRLVHAAGEHKSNIEFVDKAIKNIATDTGTTLSQLTDGAYMIESAGFHGADAMKVLRAASEGAKIEGADLGTVGNALTSVMKDLGVKSGDAASQIMSQLVAAVGHGKMTMQDFAGSIHSVLPNAASLGVSLPQVAGALATLTAEGMSADQASDNLNHTFTKLAAPTLAMGKAMASYGVDVRQVQGDLGRKGLSGTLEELQAAILKHMGQGGRTLRDAFNQSKMAAEDASRMFKNLPPDAQKIADAFNRGAISLADYRKDLKALPGPHAALLQQWLTSRNAAKGFSQALKSGTTDSQTFNQALKDMLGDQTAMGVALKLGGSHMAEFKANVNAVAHATKQADGHVAGWADTQKTFNVALAKAKEVIETTAVSIGQKLIPVLQPVIEWLTKHKQLVVDLIIGLGTFLAVYGTIATTIFVVGKAFTIYNGIVKTVRGAQMALYYAQVLWNSSALMGAIRQGAMTAQNIAGAVAAWAVGAATKAYAAGQWLLNAAMDANPIGLVIILIAALVVSLIYAYKHSETFRKIVQAAFHAVGAAIAWLGKEFMKAWNAVVGFFTGVIDWLSRNGTRITQFILAPFTGGMSLILPYIIKHWTGIKKWFSDLPQNIFNAIGDFGGWMGTIGKDIVIGIWNGLVSMGSWLWDKLMSWAKDMIPGPIARALGISSPSKVMADVVGKWIPAGIAQGVDAHAHLVKASMENLGATVGQFGMPSLGSGLSGLGAGAGGGVLEIHVHSYIDGKEVAHSIEKQDLRTGLHRGVTFQGFKK